MINERYLFTDFCVYSSRFTNDFITVRCSGVVFRRYLGKDTRKKTAITIAGGISQSETCDKEREAHDIVHIGYKKIRKRLIKKKKKERKKILLARYLKEIYNTYIYLGEKLRVTLDV